MTQNMTQNMKESIKTSIKIAKYCYFIICCFYLYLFFSFTIHVIFLQPEYVYYLNFFFYFFLLSNYLILCCSNKVETKFEVFLLFWFFVLFILNLLSIIIILIQMTHTHVFLTFFDYFFSHRLPNSCIIPVTDVYRLIDVCDPPHPYLLSLFDYLRIVLLFTIYSNLLSLAHPVFLINNILSFYYNHLEFEKGLVANLLDSNLIDGTVYLSFSGLLFLFLLILSLRRKFTKSK